MVLLGILGARAHADVGVVLADPTRVGASVWTNAGHTSVYLSAVCAETPLKLRLCHAGEQGTVLTAYPDFHEAADYQWNAIPLSLYLYGSMHAEDAPLYASPALKRARESAATQQFLAPVCAGACPEVTHAYWRDTVAATTMRDVYVFAVHTTREQDQSFVDRMNALPNRNRYQMMTRNCADFARDMVNLYLPHAVHRDVLNDLGMMGPKAAARSFTRYAQRRPELGLYVLHFIQQPSVVARCGTARAGTETAFHQPKYLLPAAAIGDHEVAGSFFVSYFLTGRFSLQHTYERYATLSPAAFTGAVSTGDARGDASVGQRAQWKAYRSRFAGAVQQAVEDGTLRSRKELRHVFTELDDQTLPALDPQGHAWLVWHAGTTEERRAGAEWSNVQSPASDPWLARRMLLARMDAELRGPVQARPPLQVFAREWALLEALQQQASPLHQAERGSVIPQVDVPASTR